jgi:hypothetical protein
MVILPMESEAGVADTERQVAESAFLRTLSESGKYTLVDRARLEKILKEKSLLASGIVDSDKGAELGRLLAAEKLIQLKIAKQSASLYTVSGRVLDVSTGRIEFTPEESTKNFPPATLSKNLATQLLNRYPLTGRILGVTEGTHVLSLGARHGLVPSSRCFVARKKTIKDEAGNVLFENLARIGVLEITEATEVGAIGKIRSLAAANQPPQKGDVVSPEPIAGAGNWFSNEQLMPPYVKGRLLLDDNMVDKRHLSMTYGIGEPYSNGAFHLNATKLPTGMGYASHAYTYYPSPWNLLDDFVFEGEIEFHTNDAAYDKANIVFRSTGKFAANDGYQLYLNDDGAYAVSYYTKGNLFELIPLQSTASLKRGYAKNKFRIVALGPLFELWWNDQFVSTFHDERFERGTVGMMVSAGVWASFDQFKIWEIRRKK